MGRKWGLPSGDRRSPAFAAAPGGCVDAGARGSARAREGRGGDPWYRRRRCIMGGSWSAELDP